MPARKRPREPVKRADFRRSANIELDAMEGPASGHYVVTPCARRTLERILSGVEAGHATRTWTLTGPYGSGKSSFVLFLASVFGGKAMASHNRMIAALRASAPDLAEQVGRITGRGKGLLPILVAGAREPLADAILRAARTALESCSSRASRALLNRLPKPGLRHANPDPAALLSSVHECVTSNGQDFAGCLLVLDELGKLLEYSASDPTRSDVHVLQRIAEYAARASTPLLILGILHQDFSGYARDLPASERAEWEKVRGRFEDIAFDEPADEALRLLARAWHGVNGALTSNAPAWLALCEEAVRLGFTPRALREREAATILASCWPLHPLTALILGPVFKRFGQNERSAFSFLHSHEPFSLREFIDQGEASRGQLFTVARLYDYLVGTIGDALLSNRDGKRWAEALDLERRLSDLDPVATAVFKTVGLLGIVGRWHDLAPSPDAIRFALGPNLAEQQVNEAIAALTQRSVLVLRQYNNSLSLWEGSDVDIESRLAAAKSAVPADSGTVPLLRRHFHTRPLIARRHSFNTGTLRFFAIEYVRQDGLAQHLATCDACADGRLLVVLDEHDRSAGADTAPGYLQDRRDVVAVVPRNNREIGFLAQEMACIQWVREHTPALTADSTARRELDTREADVHRRLQTELTHSLFGRGESTSGALWLHRGKKLRIETQRDLNETLSSVCDELFPDAPVIKNEIINRRELSSSAAAARRNVIERMILNGAEHELGITGNPPERSIYLSVLRALGLHIKGAAGWHFTTDPRSAKNEAPALFVALRSFFDDAEQRQRTVAELLSKLQAAPFGIRLGVLPIIVCAAVLAHEADVALYENGAFVPQLTVPIFERLMKSPDTFALRRWRITGVRSAVFHQIAEMLGQQELPDRIGRREVLEVVRPLVKFVRKLDKFTLGTQALDRTTLAVREALVKATEPDQLLFVDLPNACGVPPFDGTKRSKRDDVERYLTSLQAAVSNLQRTYERLLTSVHESLAQAFDSAGDLTSTRHVLAHRSGLIESVAFDPDVRALVSRIADSAPDDRQWLESIAALVVGIPVPVWRDDDRARFDVALSQRARRFKVLELLVVDRKRAGVRGNDLHSIRLGVAGSSFGDREEVVHIRSKELADANILARSLLDHLQAHTTNGHRAVALAALAKATHDFLEKQPQSVAALVGDSS